MKKTILILFCFISIQISSVNVNAQVNQEWVKRYNSSGTNNDYASALAYDNAGNVYITGFGGSNYITIKYSPQGTALWQAVYNGPVNDADRPAAIYVDLAENVYVTGRSFGNGTGTDFATVKYNSSGTQLWAQRYNGTNNDDDAAVSVAVDAGGNVYAGGWSSSSAGSTDYTIVKYSAAGSQVWVRHYNGAVNGNEFMNEMIIDGVGNLYATGKSRGTSSDDFATVKYSPAGTLLWVSRYEGSDADEGVSLTVDVSGNVIVTGVSETAATGEDYTTVKYNNAGVQQWLKKYNRVAASTDIPVGIKTDINGNVFVTGYCTGSNTSSYDYITLCYNSGGNQQWVKVFNSGLVGVDDKASSIDIDVLGNIYVTGMSISSGTDFDYGTVKYSNSGDLLWSILYESPFSGNDIAVAVKTDNNGNVYVTGSATGSVTGYDFVTVKYSQPIGITPISSEIPENFSLGQNYPNPFNPATKIRFAISGTSVAQTFLSVYDILGREVATLVNEQLKPGTYEVDFDGSNFSSGVYFYHMETEGFTDVKKMVVVK